MVDEVERVIALMTSFDETLTNQTNNNNNNNNTRVFLYLHTSNSSNHFDYQKSNFKRGFEWFGERRSPIIAIIVIAFH